MNNWLFKLEFTLLRILLFPISIVWLVITELKNILYYYKILQSRKFNAYLINIGNIRVGGTGKTPLIDFLFKHLPTQNKIGVISKGYQRKNKETLIANLNLHNISDIGDENYLLLTKYPFKDFVITSSKSEGIQILEHRKNNIIIIEDAYHHQNIKFSKNILLKDYKHCFQIEWLLPTGNLRELSYHQNRADIIVITKCPYNMGIEEAKKIADKQNLKPYQAIFFSTIQYQNLIHLFNNKILYTNQAQPVIALHGIAQGNYFLEHLNKNFKLALNLEFADHHSYTISDVEFVIVQQKKIPQSVIITTEKDAIKLKQFSELLSVIEIYVLPMEMEFLFNQKNNFIKDIIS